MDSDLAARLTPAASTSGSQLDVLTLFAAMWAMANLFHVLGPSGRAVDVFGDVSTVGLLHVAIAVAALAVLLAPRSFPRLLVLAALGPLSAWFEAPIVGSHWMLVALVDIGILAAAVSGVRNFPRNAIVLARWGFVIGYGFAAFAKLNSGFFDPAVSCGNFYVDELARSLDLGFTTASSGLGGYVAPTLTALTELSIPVLLIVRRTRLFGVVLGLLFHSVIALDQSHLFSDFSSVLFALFLLFLPPAFAASVFGWFRSLATRERELLRVMVVAALGVVLVAQWFNRERLFVDGRAWAWIAYDVVVIGAVATFIVRSRAQLEPERHAFSWKGVSRWLVIVPLLVVFTGVAPYFELRTAYSFNMYANLVTADGDSNHFIVRRTLPLTDFQSDRVTIVSSGDPGLALYAAQRWDLPYLQLRAYLGNHPDATAIYMRDGVQHEAGPGFDDPVPSWEQKFFAFRALDQAPSPRCQPNFLPAN